MRPLIDHVLKKRLSGQSLAEYGLIGSTILACSVMAVMLLGNGLNQALAKVKSDARQHIGTARKSEAIRQSAQAQLAATAGGISSVDLSNPDILDPNAFLTSVQTTGGNGTTKVLAQQIKGMAQTLLENGEITEEQAQTLFELAEQGLRMARLQKMVEDAARAAGSNWEQFDNTQLVVDGVTYSPTELARQFAWLSESGYNYDPSQPLAASDAGAEMLKFTELYQKALQDGSLRNSTALDSVTKLSTEILFTSDMVENANHWRDGYTGGEVSNGSVSGMFQDIYNNETLVHTGQAPAGTASEVTEDDSGQICDTGGGSVNQGNCQ